MIMHRNKQLELYLYDFFSNRFEDFDLFYKSTYIERRNAIYELNNGTKLMDFLHSIYAVIEDELYFPKLIPNKFASPDVLFTKLTLFKIYLEKNQI